MPHTSTTTQAVRNLFLSLNRYHREVGVLLSLLYGNRTFCFCIVRQAAGKYSCVLVVTFVYRYLCIVKLFEPCRCRMWFQYYGGLNAEEGSGGGFVLRGEGEGWF